LKGQKEKLVPRIWHAIDGSKVKCHERRKIWANHLQNLNVFSKFCIRKLFKLVNVCLWKKSRMKMGGIVLEMEEGDLNNDE
jgi:hypothetical protein